MAQNSERVQSRLNNIHAIEPLIGALRTLSMGTWQMALNKLARMQQYERYYNQILLEILPMLEEREMRKLKKNVKQVDIADTILLIIGAERGLCGKFNKILIQNAINWIKGQAFPSYQIWAMGSRMIRDLERNDIEISWRKPLPLNKLASYQQSYLTSQNWLEQFENYAFNQFIVLFNQTARGGRYQFSAFKLLPYNIHHPLSIIGETEVQKHWPPPIIETDPKGLYNQIVEHFIASSFHQILLKSAAAEHSTRYNLMQNAEDNAKDIIEELKQVINQERKRKITQEIQELASGAGLLDN